MLAVLLSVLKNIDLDIKVLVVRSSKYDLWRLLLCKADSVHNTDSENVAYNVFTRLCTSDSHIALSSSSFCSIHVDMTSQ